MSRSTMMLDGNAKPVQVMRPKTGSTQKVSYTVSAANTTEFASTVGIRVACTTACHVEIGPSATATTNDMYLPAGTVEYLYVRGGDRVSAIRSASDGILYVTEMD